MTDKVSDKPLLEKLGVKPDMVVVIEGIRDTAFLKSLRDAGAVIAKWRARDADLIFLAAAREGDLSQIASLKVGLAPNGALWVVRPRGVKEITEAQVMKAGLDAGLVDVKVVRFSDSHTAEKFVYRLKDR